MISFVYFDIGGVVLLDFYKTNKWKEMKKEIGINEKNDEIFDLLWKKYNREVCLTRDVDSLIPIIEKKCQIKFQKNYSLLQDIVDRFEKNPSIWPVIKKISDICHVGLLTDMYPRMFETIENRGLFPNVNWDIIVNSSVCGFKKPERQIFEIAEKSSKIPKNEILFVDNLEENVEAAKSFGWQAFLYDPADPVSSSQKLSELF